MAKGSPKPEQVDDILADFLDRPKSSKERIVQADGAASIAQPESVFGDEELPPDSMPLPSASARIPRTSKRPDTKRTDVQGMIEQELDSVREGDLDARYEAEGELDAQAHIAAVHPRSLEDQTTERNPPRSHRRAPGFDEATVVGRRPKLSTPSARKQLFIFGGIIAGGLVVLTVGLWLVLATTASKETVAPRATRTGVSDHETTDGPRPRAPAKPRHHRR